MIEWWLWKIPDQPNLKNMYSIPDLGLDGQLLEIDHFWGKFYAEGGLMFVFEIELSVSQDDTTLSDTYLDLVVLESPTTMNLKR